MKTVAMGDLKSHLSRYVHMARAGEEFLVTDQGEVVAELRPPRPVDAGYSSGLEKLIRSGRLRPAAIGTPARYKPLGRLAPEGTAARLLDAERGE